MEVSPEGPEHDVVRYVANPFDDLGITSMVRSMEISWARMWAKGQEPF